MTNRQQWQSFCVIIIVWICLTNFITDINCNNNEHHVVSQCKEKCVENTAELLDVNGGACDTNCLAEQCQRGCRLWKQALLANSSCSAACQNEANLATREKQRCISGCKDAVDIYAQEIKDLLTDLVAPKVLDNHVTNQSIRLIWEDASRTQGLNVTLHLQLAEGEDADWQWMGEWKAEESPVLVDGMRPYMLYKFRIVIKIVEGKPMVTTPESIPVVTHEYGVPSDPPGIISKVAQATSIHLKLRPPKYINAPLVGYRLNITLPNIVNSRPKIKEVTSNTKDVIGHVLTRLSPNTIYELSIAAMNIHGAGPAKTLQITTASPTQGRNTSQQFEEEGLVNDGGVPKFVIGEGKYVLAKDLDEESVFSLPKELYESSNDIVTVTGVAMHYPRNLSFVSLSNGSIQKIEENDTMEVYHTTNGNGELDVDWLNHKLYIAEKDKILRCELNGDKCVTVVDQLSPRPEDIKVDPYNGYFFWAQFGRDKGIYRVDLNHIPSYGTRGRAPIDVHHIIQAELVSTFAIDFENYQLFYPNATDNTVMSANLDGNGVIDVRPNTGHNEYLTMTRMVQFEGIFIWTNGSKVYIENLDTSNSKLYINEMFFYHPTEYKARFAGLNIWHPDAQPVPVPIHPPQNVQSAFTSDSVLVSWEKPDFNQGPGSWNEWQYEVMLVDASSGLNRTFAPLNSTTLHVSGLEPNGMYSLKVRAYSPTGHGPYSSRFLGHTVTSADAEAFLMGVGEDDMLRQLSLIGQPQNSQEDEYIGLQQVAQLEKVNNKLLWVSESGQMYMTHSNSPVPTEIRDFNDVKLFAYDWLGDVLYWVYKNTRPASNIYRMNLKLADNMQPEVVMQDKTSYAIRALALDSVAGYIYWHTERSLQASRLNGDHSRYIFREDAPFSDRYVVSLALDHDHNLLYFLVRSRDGMALYKRSLADTRDNSRPNTNELHMTFELPDRSNDLPHLHYISNKLLWLGQHNNLNILDTRAQTAASLSLNTTHKMKLLTLAKQRNQTFPDGVTKSNDVIPAAVDFKSFTLHGDSADFTIQWDPVSVKHGQVFYEVQLQYEGKVDDRNQLHSSLRMREVSPYTHIELSVQACTYWGCSDPTAYTLTSPMGVPSPPKNPRCYIEHHKSLASDDLDIEVDFRWESPANESGIISRYMVTYSTNSGEGPWQTERRVKGMRYLQIRSVYINTIYYFKVRACTQAGCGPYSAVASANTTNVRPIAELLISTSKNVQLVFPGSEQLDGKQIVNKGAKSVAYIARDDAAYIIDGSGMLHKKDASTNGSIKKLSRGDRQSTNLCVDWVGRTLYWSVLGDYNTSIMRLHLDVPDTEPAPLISRRNNIYHMDINPQNGSLYWTENEGSGKFQLMQLQLGDDQSPPRPVFNARSQCSNTCQFNGPLQADKLFSVDLVTESLILVQSGSGDIWSSSPDGCHCHLLASNPLRSRDIDKLAVDLYSVHWLHGDQLYSVKKTLNSQVRVHSDSISNVRDMKSYGAQLQPMPDYACLVLGNYSGGATLVQARDNSLLLRVHQYEPSPECAHLSLPPVAYTVHYHPVKDQSAQFYCNGFASGCDKKESYDTGIELKGLSSFTTYAMQVSATNYYTNASGEETNLGPVSFFTTTNGVPTAPREVVIVALNSSSVKVTWRSPSTLNGLLDDIMYKIMWRNSPDYSHLISLKGTQVEGLGKGRFYEHTINKLSPGERYYFKVSAYFNEQDTSPSNETSLRMYPAPGYVTPTANTENSIDVEWMAPATPGIKTHNFQIAKHEDPVKWQSCSRGAQETQLNKFYKAFCKELLPNTNYRLRVHVTHQSALTEAGPYKIIKTNSTVPKTPSAPVMARRGSAPIVEWNPPSDGGNEIEEFRLDARLEDGYNWSTVANTTMPHWVVKGLQEEEVYVFRVAARNALGWSNISEESESVKYLAFVYDTNKENNVAQVLYVVLGILIILMIAVCLAYLVYLRRHSTHSKLFPSKLLRHLGMPVIDTELATLRELPRNGMVLPNALYSANYVPTDEDIASLPHIRREQLTLTQFLGSGAFGEVFEGVVKDLGAPHPQETPVAVKTLRKSATTQEKDQFLKEAVLMSTIKHENILGLLGVCLDSEAQLIILELMDGGDLLSYLRVHRSTSFYGASASSSAMAGGALTLLDMLDMMLDVCDGCCFLEDMHLVHRDLAARNCLVSLNPTSSDKQRIVKIGDFGLARDIYKSDYYRKEGEGLMPVKWMSPESLIDGVFTTHSDVWSFGVLAHEIVTLGEQPYPARTNLDVLNFVRFGGRLDRPDNCPEELYELMRKCWQFEPKDRPTFHDIDRQLKEFRTRPIQPPEPHYIKNGGLKVQLPAENKYEPPNMMPEGNKRSGVRRSESLNLHGRNTLGVEAAGTNRGHDGYLEPVRLRENKYLELLLPGKKQQSNRCLHCQAKDCKGSCNAAKKARGLARHSSDCSSHYENSKRRKPGGYSALPQCDETFPNASETLSVETDLRVPRVQRSQSYSPRYSMPPHSSATMPQAHHTTSVDSIKHATANGTIPKSQHRYENMKPVPNTRESLL